MQADRSEEKFFTKPLLVIFLTVFIDLIGFGMVIPILPFYAEKLNATPAEIGWIFSIYSWMQFFFAPILGRISDKVGRRPIIFLSLLGSAVGYFVIGFAETLTLVFIGRVICGITGANISTAQAYIADITSKENRAKGMGLFGAAFGLGFILGPAIAGLLSKYGIHVPFYFAAGLSLLNAFALYLFLPESLKRDSDAPVPVRKNRIVGFLSSFTKGDFGSINLVYFLLVMAFSIMTYAFVLFTEYRYHYDAEDNGYLFTYIGVIAVIAQGMMFNPLVKRYGESWLVIFGSVLMVVGLFALPFLQPGEGGLPVLLTVMAMFAFGNSLASPGLTSLASKTAGEFDQGEQLGNMQSGASLARAIGPTLGGYLLSNAVGKIDDPSLVRTFWVSSAIMLMACIVAVFWLRHVRGEEH